MFFLRPSLSVRQIWQLNFPRYVRWHHPKVGRDPWFGMQVFLSSEYYSILFFSGWQKHLRFSRLTTWEKAGFHRVNHKKMGAMPCPKRSQVLLPPWKEYDRFYRVPIKSLLRVQITLANVYLPIFLICNIPSWAVFLIEYDNFQNRYKSRNWSKRAFFN